MKTKQLYLLTLTLISLVACGDGHRENKDASTIEIDSIDQTFNSTFHHRLTNHSGVWKATVPDTSQPFTHFAMAFQLDQNDTLRGKIFGLYKNGDTAQFWKIKEYFDTVKNEWWTVQTGEMGHAAHPSEIDSNHTRSAEFVMNYYNGAEENIRDSHSFINDSTIVSKSKNYDVMTRTWIEQPSSTWTLEK